MVGLIKPHVDITTELLRSAIGPSPWDLGNDVLYGLCRTHPGHSSKAAVIAKIWLIGRSYAAAIERRRNKTDANDDFYVDVVAPKMADSEIDKWLQELGSVLVPTGVFAERIVRTHGQVTRLFKEITELEKRSLASKYLHFHLPKLFFIYDARAVKGLQRLRQVVGRASAVSTEGGDDEYRKFFEKCLRLQQHIKIEFDVSVSPRELDKLLLHVSADGPSKKHPSSG
jgi:hypothetical protein